MDVTLKAHLSHLELGSINLCWLFFNATMSSVVVLQYKYNDKDNNDWWP
jgi:hypothetical protein